MTLISCKLLGSWHQMLGVKMVAPSNELVARTNNVNHAVELGRLAGLVRSIQKWLC